jgi:hypothetical protein
MTIRLDNLDGIRVLFVKTSGWIFAITGIAKFVSAFGKAKLLGYHDPITNLTFHHLMLLGAIVEISVALFCLLLNKFILATKLIAWLATVLIGYRIGLWLAHWQSPCPCLGTLTDAIHIPPEVADTVLKAILGYLLCGSYFILLCNQRARIDPIKPSSAIK